VAKIGVAIQKESWALREPFRFAGHVIEASNVVVVTLTDGDLIGRGEATGVIYLSETQDSLFTQIAQPEPKGGRPA
jgi:L-alanine-DL-glutamate epimerase-like enolase superfamily enzyme